MFVALFGPDSAAFNLVTRLARIILSARYPDLTLIHAENFEEFKDLFARRRSPHVFYSCHYPDTRIAQTLINGKAPCLILSEPALSMIAALRRIHGVDVNSAIRITSRHYAAMEPFTAGPNTDYLPLRDFDDSLVNLIGALTAALKCPMTERAIADLAADIGDPSARSIKELAWTPHGGPPPRPYEAHLAAADIEAIEKTFPPLEALPRLGLRWPSRLFYAENIDTLADEPVSLLGRPRTLFFGPHLYLPSGKWRAAFHINVARNQSGNIMLADIQCNLKVLTVGRMALPKEGSFQFSLDFELASMEHTLEARIGTIEGGIGGMIELVDVSFARR